MAVICDPALDRDGSGLCLVDDGHHYPKKEGSWEGHQVGAVLVFGRSLESRPARRIGGGSTRLRGRSFVLGVEAGYRVDGGTHDGTDGDENRDITKANCKMRC